MARPVTRCAHRRLTAVLAVVLLLPGCYSGRAVWGGLRILAQRRPVGRILADPATDPALAERLRTVRELRRFAVAQLGLPDNRSYLSYVELDRDYAVWNVTAAPELSVEPVTWCFPVAGCVSYRGYFTEERARRFADKLRRRGHDVDVGGVGAFSTLGWFADPVLSTFIDYSNPDLARLVFHELAHQRLYVKGDTTFNESFATLVEEEGVHRWLGTTGRTEALAADLASRRREEQFSRLVLRFRDRLAEVYSAAEPDDWKRRQKALILAELRSEHRSLKAGWNGWNGYDIWFGAGLNNARIAAVGAYHDLVPDLRRLLNRVEGDLARFYERLEDLSGLSPAERAARLRRAPSPLLQQ